MAWNLSNGKESTIAQINITPLTDVMLVLLVVFMVTTPLLMMDSMKLKLPTAETAGAQDGEGVFLSISRDGLYYINGKEIKKIQLKEAIISALDDNATVIIKADKSVRHGKVVELLDLARKAGAKKLSIATEHGGAGG